MNTFFGLFLSLFIREKKFLKILRRKQMGFLQLILLIILPFLANIRETDAGCCCCCCPSCCCKPIIIKLPPPPVKLCPCCCGCGCGCCCCKPCCCCCCKPCCCCCCKPCCCCCPCCCCGGGGGGGRKRRSVVDLMARKFADVFLPQHNQDATMSAMNGGGCGGAPQGVSLSPLHALCSQIPPAQRGPACQQITQHAAQQFPLSQNIFNHPQGALMSSPTGASEFDCANCPGCQSGTCQGCAATGQPGQAFGAANCDAGPAGQHCNCAPGGVGTGGVNPSAFHALGEENAFGQSFDAPSPCAAAAAGALGVGATSGGGRRKRRTTLLRDEAMLRKASQEGTKTKREVKNQLVFRNNLEFVLRQSPPALSANL